MSFEEMPRFKIFTLFLFDFSLVRKIVKVTEVLIHSSMTRQFLSLFQLFQTLALKRTKQASK